MPAKAKPKAKKPARASKARKAASKSARARSKPKPAAKGKPQGRLASGGADWRPATLDRMRRLIWEADPGVIEEVKWRKPSNAMQGVPTWSHDGLICTGETYKDKVKLTFARGASLPDPAGLFNAEDRGATRRAIDIRKGQQVDPVAFKQLVRDAVEVNNASRSQ